MYFLCTFTDIGLNNVTFLATQNLRHTKRTHKEGGEHQSGQEWINSRSRSAAGWWVDERQVCRGRATSLLQQDVRDELSQEGKSHLRQDTHTHTHTNMTERQKQAGEQWKDERGGRNTEWTLGNHWPQPWHRECKLPASASTIQRALMMTPGSSSEARASI